MQYFNLSTVLFTDNFKSSYFIIIKFIYKHFTWLFHHKPSTLEIERLRASRLVTIVDVGFARALVSRIPKYRQGYREGLVVERAHVDRKERHRKYEISTPKCHIYNLVQLGLEKLPLEIYQDRPVQ